MDLMLDDFQGRVNETFTLRLDDLALELTLTEAEPVGSPRPGAAREQAFALVFTGPQEPIISQGMHRMEHPGMGELDIFLVPIGSDAGGTRYEAVFN